MAKYHLYFLKNRSVVGADDIEAASNLDAVRIAQDYARGQAVEVWNAHSLIQTIAPSPEQVQPAS
jgi:hypothetical protein